MMIEFRFVVGDLARTSFAYSPFQEAVYSLRTWRDPARYPHQRPWLRRLAPAFARLDTELLTGLIAPSLWIPDFLTPRPDRPRPGFERQLDELSRTDPALLAGEFTAAYGRAPLPPVVRDGLAEPAAFLDRICHVLAAYWHSCLAPDWWPRAHTILEADLAHRGKVLAEEGARGLFASLDPRLTFNGEVLTLVKKLDRHPWPKADVRIGGRGLVVLPTLFAAGAHTSIDYTLPPMLVYPARGRATISETPPPVTDEALTRLLGAARARLLHLLAEPASTTELAHLLAVTPGAVSQHLAVLYDAGLLTRARSGRSVRYVRSELGERLCG
ncbi:ArsR/SmtB family transcription factor [Streptomyces longispororuber]|uniref:ArsR/SmtB family transcription factor n=1 Tax=Streptomyces longispororuber TaxID=68230 RepID=UPI00210D7552|nr:helix-turn-helix domain-containing protein [Streptomyces longispororuber]MCQ4209649.1 helix-turn-helix domain-containing protein [Streptomyces longispororuber]